MRLVLTIHAGAHQHNDGATRLQNGTLFFMYSRAVMRRSSHAGIDAYYRNEQRRGFTGCREFVMLSPS
jgi:hypothetical protein